MTGSLEHRVTQPNYLSFPLEVGESGSATVRRAEHVRQQIEQAIFTDPGERVFRHDFGVGARALVFEPGGTALEELARKRLQATLAEVLKGEVDSRSLRIEAEAEGELLRITIEYRLAALGETVQHEFTVGAGGTSGG